MSKILSIIVPAYNVENELERCIESCKKQDLPMDAYEIIIVNDGATDNTLQVAQKIEQSSNNVTVISQDNMGLSGARNIGLKNAIGKYVWFIDSDDYIEENVLSGLISQSEKDELDCLFFRLRRVFEDDKFKQEVEDYECVQLGVEKDIVLNGSIAIIQGYNPSSVCSILFNRDFLNNNQLRFVLGIYHEDAEFTYRMISKAQRVKFINESPYLYYTHANTMTRSKSVNSIIKNRVDDVIVAKSYLQLSTELSIDNIVSCIIEKRAKSILFGLLWEIWKNREEWNKDGIASAILNKMIEEDLYPIHAPFGSWKQAIITKLIFNHKKLLIK